MNEMSTILRWTFLTVTFSSTKTIVWLQLKRKKIVNKLGMANFEEICDNVYRIKKPIETSATPCLCEKFYSNCEQFCRNRGLLIECGSCFFGEKCKNKRIQSKENAKMLLAPTELKGLGIFADENIMADQFIVEYVGEIVSHQQLVKRMAKYKRSKNKHSYIMSAECETLIGKKTMIVDATEMGNISRYFNHSCDPNCYVEIWETFGYNRIGIFAKRNIQKAEELTYDYGIEFFG